MSSQQHKKKLTFDSKEEFEAYCAAQKASRQPPQQLALPTKESTETETTKVDTPAPYAIMTMDEARKRCSSRMRSRTIFSEYGALCAMNNDAEGGNYVHAWESWKPVEQLTQNLLTVTEQLRKDSHQAYWAKNLHELVVRFNRDLVKCYHSVNAKQAYDDGECQSQGAKAIIQGGSNMSTMSRRLLELREKVNDGVDMFLTMQQDQQRRLQEPRHAYQPRDQESHRSYQPRDQESRHSYQPRDQESYRAYQPRDQESRRAYQPPRDQEPRRSFCPSRAKFSSSWGPSPQVDNNQEPRHF